MSQDEIFGDTSGFFAAFLESDARHQVAISVLTPAITIITTKLVVIETISLLTKRISSFHAHMWFDSLLESKGIMVMEYETSLMQEAEKFWKKMKDKQWDLIDCYSFCFMHKHHLSFAWTFDHHFTQAGFATILEGK